jgi:ferredoxin
VTRPLGVDPIAFDRHGLCAKPLPEFVRLDDLGYPLLDPAPVPRHLQSHARRAVTACPKLALLIQERSPGDRPTAAPRRRSRGSSP